MPYTVRSHCNKCDDGDEFVIGYWQKYLGIFVCHTCEAIVNIPLETGECPDCGYSPKIEEFYDYSRSVPYLRGQTLDRLDLGPICPKCQQADLTFETTTHFSVRPPENSNLWLDNDYLEKAIFVYALVVVCTELDLSPDNILEFYNLDVPQSLMANRRLSLPIFLDIRNHLLAVASLGPIPFKISKKFRQMRKKSS